MKLYSQAKPLLIILRLLMLAACVYVANIEAAVVRVAVASNFLKTFQALADDFESYSKHSVQASYASSGKIYNQIVHGAPFDIFLSADQDKPKLLEKNGLAVEGTRFSYAQGQLVLWSVSHQTQAQALADLKAGQFGKLAVANPKLAPYGFAAVEVLKGLNIYQRTKASIVWGENIGQTLQFANSGNVDLAFVALSQVIHLNKGSYWLVSDQLYSPIKQDIVLLNTAKDKPAATEFLQYLKTERALGIIHRHGYL